MDRDFTGKTVVITGGGSNSGRGIVLAFAGESARILIGGIDEAQAKTTREEDIVNSVPFFALPTMAGHVSGQIISVSGGEATP